MKQRMKTGEVIGTVVACTVGCAIIEGVGYAVGWTDAVGEALANWVAYSVFTSVAVILLTVWGGRHATGEKPTNEKKR